MTPDTSARGPDRRGHRLVLGALAATLLLAAAIAVPAWLLHPGRGGDAISASRTVQADLGTAPTWRLTDQHGHRVTSRQFAGRVQVVSYLFPYCTTYCPVIARNLVVLRQQLRRDGLGDRVQLVAFNIDPAGAGPAQMRAFWAEFGGDPDDPGFTFLTGTPAQIRTVVTGGFHVAYQKVSGAGEPAGGAASPGASPPPPNPLASRAHVGYDVQHNDFVEIVGAHGRVRRIFDSGSSAGPDRILDAVRAALG